MAKNKEKITVELTKTDLKNITSALMLECQTLQFLRGWGAVTIRECELLDLADRLMEMRDKNNFNNVCR